MLILSCKFSLPMSAVNARAPFSSFITSSYSTSNSSLLLSLPINCGFADLLDERHDIPSCIHVHKLLKPYRRCIAVSSLPLHLDNQSSLNTLRWPSLHVIDTSSLRSAIDMCSSRPHPRSLSYLCTLHFAISNDDFGVRVIR